MSEQSGSDWISAHDQALQTLANVRAMKPRQFVLIAENEDGASMSATIFAQNEFVASAATVLIQALVESEPDVAPPPD